MAARRRSRSHADHPPVSTPRPASFFTARRGRAPRRWRRERIAGGRAGRSDRVARGARTSRQRARLGAVIAEAAERATGRRLIFVEAGAVPRLPDLTARGRRSGAGARVAVDVRTGSRTFERPDHSARARARRRRRQLGPPPTPSAAASARPLPRRLPAGRRHRRALLVVSGVPRSCRSRRRAPRRGRAPAGSCRRRCDRRVADDRRHANVSCDSRVPVAGWKSADADTLGAAVAGSRESDRRCLARRRGSAASADVRRQVGGPCARRSTPRRRRRFARRLDLAGRRGGHDRAALALDAFVEDLAAGVPRTAPPPRDTSDDAAGHGVHAVDAIAAPGPRIGRHATCSGPAPRVSVIVVNWNGREHLGPASRRSLASDYPADRLELICVDNGSTDGSRELLRDAAFPRCASSRCPRTAASPAATRPASPPPTGDVLVFFNNDMRVEPDAGRRLVAALDATHRVRRRPRPQLGRARHRLRARHDQLRGARLPGHFGELESAASSPPPRETFFPNGGAFAVTRERLRARRRLRRRVLRLLRRRRSRLAAAARRPRHPRRGERRRLPPPRRHQSGTQPAGQKRFLMERNALWTVLKNYGERALGRALGAGAAARRAPLLDETTCRSDIAPPLAHFAPFSRALPRDAGRPASGAPAGVTTPSDATPDDAARSGGCPPSRWRRSAPRLETSAHAWRRSDGDPARRAPSPDSRRAAALRPHVRVHLELHVVLGRAGRARRGARSAGACSAPGRAC